MRRRRVPSAAAAPAAAVGLSLECGDVVFAYREGGREVPAVTGVTFALATGSTAALLGPSGSGKSTLLMLLRGILKPDRGTVLLDGVPPTDPAYAGLERRVGIVFQHPEMQLFAGTAREDVGFGPRQLGWPPADVERAVDEALESVGLPPELFGRRHPYSLSGGEQRRLALAGVLAMRPGALLLDEPFVSLDPGARRELAAILVALKSSGITILLATHDVDQAWALCDERLVLASGSLLASGAWSFGAGGEEVLTGNRLRVPSLVELWRRLGRAVVDAPRTAARAAELLS